MYKSVLPFLLFLIMFNYNAFSGDAVISLKSDNNCNFSESVILLHTGEGTGYDNCILNICDDIMVARIYDQIGKEIEGSEYYAKIHSINRIENTFNISIYSNISNELIYKLVREKNETALLTSVSADNNQLIDFSADEYFEFTQFSTFVIMKKKKQFECFDMKLIDLNGSLIYDYPANSDTYRINLENMSSAVYFITFSVEGRLLLKKIFFIKQN